MILQRMRYTPTGNYVPKYFALAAQLPNDRFHVILVLHDDLCGIDRGGVCNCDPALIAWPYADAPQ